MTSREELELIVEQQLAGVDLVTQLLEERHASAVREEHVLAGGVCSAANWCEVAQKVQASGADPALARASLLS
ncbi:MAG: hypothetical protein H7226_01910 [Salinibacterium sp.]|nr:hypothetical protein [Salinibacterium sp.]